jgi:hypothetical protein
MATIQEGTEEETRQQQPKEEWEYYDESEDDPAKLEEIKKLEKEKETYNA